jgi:hypothetical protein
LREYVPPGVRIAGLDLVHRWRWRTTAPHRRITERFVAHHGLTVQRGPFAGMRFPAFAVGRGEMLVPQLLGAYEEELQPVFEELASEPIDRIVDIGASDGYYAVGMALGWPQAAVTAYEMNPFPARVCQALATANGVRDRIDLRGECTVSELFALRPCGRIFVLCDCEGAEAELMDPDTVPWLSSATLIVELHEFASPGVKELISSRFESTHRVQLLDSRRRYAGDYRALAEVPRVNYVDRELGVNEFRPVRISWAVLRPR